VIATLSRKLYERLLRKPYRDAYVAEHVQTGISYQSRALRAQRGWAQKRLADVMGKPQSVVSRLENPDYGKLSVSTLLEVAAAYDVALVIQFVSFPEFLRRTRDVSPESMYAESFDEKQLRPLTAGNIDLYKLSPKTSTADLSVGRYGGVQIRNPPPAYLSNISVH
jgi:transcriptional regulator with XRE-family HTH domain